MRIDQGLFRNEDALLWVFLRLLDGATPQKRQKPQTDTEAEQSGGNSRRIQCATDQQVTAHDAPAVKQDISTMLCRTTRSTLSPIAAAAAGSDGEPDRNTNEVSRRRATNWRKSPPEKLIKHGR